MATSSTPQAGWTAEEIGFLAGGPGRAAEAALARLMDGGLVRFSREGLVTAVHQNGYGASSALEASILAGLCGTARPIGLVVGPAAHSQEMSWLHRSLTERAVIRVRWGKPRLTRAGKDALGHARRNPRGRVDAVALYGLRGVVGRQRVSDLYGLPPHILYPAPVRHHGRRWSSSDGGGCGGGHEHHNCAASSSCSSSSCSSSSSSCSSSSCSSSSGSSSS